MKIEAIYGVLYQHLNSDNFSETLDKWKIVPLDKLAGEAALINLCAALREEIRVENNKSNGKGDVMKAAKSIVKTAISENKEQRFGGAIPWYGKQAFCDGFRVIVLDAPIDFKEVEPWNDYKMFDNLFQDVRLYDVPLELPDVGTLKAHIKMKKAEGNNGVIKWDFGDELPKVNANYLLDMLTAFPDAKCKYFTKLKPLYFVSSIGEGVLLPNYK